MFIIKLLSQHVSGTIMPYHQENKTVYYCIWCSALVVQAVVGCGCVELRHELCVLCDGYCSTQCTQLMTQLHTTTANHSQHNQCRIPYAVIHESCSPDARNMLRLKFDNKHRISCILLVSLSSPYILQGSQ